MPVSRTTHSVCTPATREAWHEVERADPDALPTQSPEWMDSLCHATRWNDATRLYTTDQGRRLILPMAAAPVPRTAASSLRTHWGFGGLLADGGVRPDDVELVVTDLQRRGVIRQAVRPNPLHGSMWSKAASTATLVPRRAHVLDLTGGEDAVWERMNRQGRKSIRAAETRGVTIESDDTGRLLGVFFELQRRSQERWAAAQREPLPLARLRYRFYDTQQKWEHIAQHLGARCRVWVASHDGEPVVANIVLGATGNFHHTRSASQPAAARTYAAEALVWAAVRHACAAGARTYHMGESGDSESLARFKEKLGCVAHEYPEVRFERLPITAVDHRLRSGVKRLIGFRDQH